MVIQCSLDAFEKSIKMLFLNNKLGYFVILALILITGALLFVCSEGCYGVPIAEDDIRRRMKVEKDCCVKTSVFQIGFYAVLGTVEPPQILPLLRLAKNDEKHQL